jgi:hypothetical protein
VIQNFIDYLVKNASEILVKLKQLFEHLPEQHQNQAESIFTIATYSLLVLVLGGTVWKVWKTILSFLTATLEWISVIARAVNQLLKDVLIEGISKTFKALIIAQTYKNFFDWCAMTDKELASRSEFADGTTPRLLQRQLGFIVLLASLWAFFSAFFAGSYSLASDNLNTISLNQLLAVASAAFLYSLFVFSFDRVVAGTTNINFTKLSENRKKTSNCSFIFLNTSSHCDTNC